MSHLFSLKAIIIAAFLSPVPYSHLIGAADLRLKMIGAVHNLYEHYHAPTYARRRSLIMVMIVMTASDIFYVVHSN